MERTQGDASTSSLRDYSLTYISLFSLHTLLADAQRLCDPSWNAAFYDEIASYVHDLPPISFINRSSLVGSQVPGYLPSSQRGTFTSNVKLPEGAQNAVAVLSANRHHFQDSALDTSAYQYWADVVDGAVTIPRVKAGTYRLTVYANGM